MKTFLKILCMVFLVGSTVQGQTVRKEPWTAQWITGPGSALTRTLIDTDAALRDYGVYLFRKTITIDTLPSSFLIHVSADNRYKLFVNEQLVSLGPARGDLYFWNYETVDLRPYLQQGRNVVAAVVWNFGALRPEAQISYRTGFIVQGYSKTEEVLNTDTSWKATRDNSYQPLQNNVPGYYVAGPGETVRMELHPKGWTAPDFNDRQWPPARPLLPGHTKETIYDSPAWMLVPSPLPPMELKPQRLAALRKTEGVFVPAGFPAMRTPVTIPTGTKAVLLLDQGALTNAYPTLAFSGGKNATINLGYAEALYIPDTTQWDTTRGPGPRFRIAGKGNRNEVEGKIFIGTRDSIVSDGSTGQQFTPLWWRTYRYLQLSIATREESLVIDDLFGTFTGYPFVHNARFESPDASLQQLLDIGWHTARLCAYETYMDCPFWEQLQYIGDTRIQTLVSLYNSGDDRLVRHALDLADHSRIAEGITLSRWPSHTPQQIPTFSLWYIGMLHDYYRYGRDTAFVQEKLPGTRQVLSWFSKYQTADGALKDVPYWNFTDWRGDSGWLFGMAPVGKRGESAVLDLQLLCTYQLAADMERSLGMRELARHYTAKAEQLKRAIRARYWDPVKKLYADTEGKDLFSQHTNSLALLSGIISGTPARELALRMLQDTSMTQASIYFKYYLHQALTKAGLGNHYLSWLDIWHENIRQGLTTWAEIPDVNHSRSDCHAWGSSPNIELYRTVLGIDSDAPAFRKVRIKPHLGALKSASGSIPHPEGTVSVSYREQGKRWNIEIILPQKVTGSLVWKGKTFPLKGGWNVFSL